MFHVGKTYTFHTLELDGERFGRVSHVSVVVAVEGPLVKLRSGTILNTHALTFEGAQDAEAQQQFLRGASASLQAALEARKAEGAG